MRQRLDSLAVIHKMMYYMYKERRFGYENDFKNIMRSGHGCYVACDMGRRGSNIRFRLDVKYHKCDICVDRYRIYVHGRHRKGAYRFCYSVSAESIRNTDVCDNEFRLDTAHKGKHEVLYLPLI